MPIRKLVLANNEIYHVFNSSVANEEIFARKNNLFKILKTVRYYRFPHNLRLSKFESLPPSLKKEYLDKIENKEPLVEMYAFAFMSNHYHFLIKQLQDRGISRFISNLQNSFARTFNLKNSRGGALFKNPFKAKRIETNEQFIHVSRYIHLNPVTSFLIEFDKLANYPWTSFPVYAGEDSVPFLNTEFLLRMFSSGGAYINFVKDQVSYQRELALIKNLILETS